METDKHHVFFERRKYRTSLERLARNAGGLVITTLVQDHKQLHANVPPPPKPDRELMIGMVEMLRQQSIPHYSLDGVEMAIAFFDKYDCEDIADNLSRQLHYLSGDYL